MRVLATRHATVSAGVFFFFAVRSAASKRYRIWGCVFLKPEDLGKREREQHIKPSG